MCIRDRLLPLFTSTFVPPYIMEKAGILVPLAIKIFTLLIVLGTITLFGFLVSRVAGRKILDFLEKRVFFKIPLVSIIYRTIKEINEVLFTGKKYVFKRVVILEYPRRGIYSIGFVTTETLLENSSHSSPQKFLSVFIPTTPNPTSGYLALVPEKDTIPLPLGMQKAFKLIISGGALISLYKDELNKAFQFHRLD